MPDWPTYNYHTHGKLHADSTLCWWCCGACRRKAKELNGHQALAGMKRVSHCYNTASLKPAFRFLHHQVCSPTVHRPRTDGAVIPHAACMLHVLSLQSCCRASSLLALSSYSIWWDEALQPHFMVTYVCIMLQVKLPGNPRSSFWRFHTEGTADEGVCTIEAIHLFMRALAGEQHTLQARRCSALGLTAAGLDCSMKTVGTQPLQACYIDQVLICLAVMTLRTHCMPGFKH